MTRVQVILLGLLLWAVYTDMTQTRISNRLIVLGLLIGLPYRICAEGYVGVVFFFLNLIIPVILLYLLFQMRALGAGDIKLFSMISVFLPTEAILELIAAAFVAGAVFGIFKWIFLFILMQRELGKPTRIHFSPAILFAYLYIVWR